MQAADTGVRHALPQGLACTLCLCFSICEMGSQSSPPPESCWKDWGFGPVMPIGHPEGGSAHGSEKQEEGSRGATQGCQDGLESLPFWSVVLLSLKARLLDLVGIQRHRLHLPQSPCAAPHGASALERSCPWVGVQ